MSQWATWMFLAVAFNFAAFAQAPGGWASVFTPASPGWPFGPPHRHVSLEGVLARSDGETLSVILHDQRVIRFRLDERTRYKPEAQPEKLSSFHAADVVAVEAEVDGKGYLMAHTVRFVRTGSAAEKSQILESPEVMQRWRENVISGNGIDPAADDRKLNLVAKPKAIPDPEEDSRSRGRAGLLRLDLKNGAAPSRAEAGKDDLIASIRRTVNDAFDKLPNLRAKQVTSMFHSSTKPVKWIPDNVVAAEVAYEESRESYSDIRIDGKRPADAPTAVDSDYMRSLDKAWSTGDFETISHCVFSELEDSDFRKVRTEHSDNGNLVVYEFSGGRASECMGVKFRSEVAYPAYTGQIKVRAETREVLHVELEATGLPSAFPLDRAERSVDFSPVRIGDEQYSLPSTAYWFGCFRNSYACFLNRVDFSDYRRFTSKSIIQFDK
jgi:hypothetical protein